MADSTISNLDKAQTGYIDTDEQFVIQKEGSAAATKVLTTDIFGGWRDMIAPFSAGKAGTSPPGFIQMIDDGAGSTGIFAYAFDAALEEELFLTFHIDHDYKVGTPFYPHVHWAPATTNTGVVRWGIEWTYAHRDDDTPLVLSTSQFTYIEQAGSGTALTHQVAEVPDPGITLNGCQPDTIVVARIFRDATHANDTFTGDAFGLFLDAHYQTQMYATKNRAPDFYT